MGGQIRYQRFCRPSFIFNSFFQLAQKVEDVNFHLQKSLEIFDKNSAVKI